MAAVWPPSFPAAPCGWMWVRVGGCRGADWLVQGLEAKEGGFISIINQTQTSSPSSLSPISSLPFPPRLPFLCRFFFTIPPCLFIYLMKPNLTPGPSFFQPFLWLELKSYTTGPLISGCGLEISRPGGPNSAPETAAFSTSDSLGLSRAGPRFYSENNKTRERE